MLDNVGVKEKQRVITVEKDGELGFRNCPVTRYESGAERGNFFRPFASQLLKATRLPTVT